MINLSSDNEIEIPEDAEVIYHDAFSKKWLTKGEWEQQMSENPYYDTLYEQIKGDGGTFFLMFFVTQHPEIKNPGWEHLMGVYGYYIEDTHLGTWIEVLGITWYGYPVKTITNIDDLTEEAEQYFPKLLSHLDILKEGANNGKFYYTYAGDVINYPDMLNDIKYVITERKPKSKSNKIGGM